MLSASLSPTSSLVSFSAKPGPGKKARFQCACMYVNCPMPPSTFYCGLNDSVHSATLSFILGVLFSLSTHKAQKGSWLIFLKLKPVDISSVSPEIHHIHQFPAKIKHKTNHFDPNNDHGQEKVGDPRRERWDE